MNLEELLLDQIKDIYNAEGQLVKALPKLTKASTTAEVKQTFQTHLAQTKGQVERLQQVFAHLGTKPKGELCKGMQGLIEEGQEHAEQLAGDLFGDLAIIGASLRVEHYEIAAYESAISLAKTLKHAEVVQLLQESLQEEQQAAKLWVQLAKPLLKEGKDLGQEEE